MYRISEADCVYYIIELNKKITSVLYVKKKEWK